MALRWLEGFEGCTEVEEVHGRVYATVTGSSLAAENGVEGSSGEAVSSYDNVFTTKPLVGAVQNTWTMGFAFRYGGSSGALNDSDIPYMALQNTDGEQIRFELLEDSDAGRPGGQFFRIRVMRGAVELATSNERFHYANEERSWIFLELQVTIDNSAGAFSGRFQYPTKPSLNSSGPHTTITWDAASSSVDTQNQTSSGADRFEFSMVTGNVASRMLLDDIYLCDSTGSKNNNFLGKVSIEGQAVSGDGNTTDWALTGGAVSTADAWGEPTTGSDDDKRLITNATTQVHLASVDALTLLPAGATVVGVRQDLYARMETVGDLDIAHMFRKTTATAAETDAGTALNVSTTAYDGDAAVLEDDPNTATDWEVADLNSYQHGARNDG